MLHYHPVWIMDFSRFSNISPSWSFVLQIILLHIYRVTSRYLLPHTLTINSSETKNSTEYCGEIISTSEQEARRAFKENFAKMKMNAAVKPIVFIYTADNYGDWSWLLLDWSWIMLNWIGFYYILFGLSWIMLNWVGFHSVWHSRIPLSWIILLFVDLCSVGFEAAWLVPSPLSVCFGLTYQTRVTDRMR